MANSSLAVLAWIALVSFLISRTRCFPTQTLSTPQDGAHPQVSISPSSSSTPPSSPPTKPQEGVIGSHDHLLVNHAESGSAAVEELFKMAEKMISEDTTSSDDRTQKQNGGQEIQYGGQAIQNGDPNGDSNSSATGPITAVEGEEGVMFAGRARQAGKQKGSKAKGDKAGGNKKGAGNRRRPISKRCRANKKAPGCRRRKGANKKKGSSKNRPASVSQKPTSPFPTRPATIRINP